MGVPLTGEPVRSNPPPSGKPKKAQRHLGALSLACSVDVFILLGLLSNFTFNLLRKQHCIIYNQFHKSDVCQFCLVWHRASTSLDDHFVLYQQLIFLPTHTLQKGSEGYFSIHPEYCL